MVPFSLALHGLFQAIPAHILIDSSLPFSKISAACSPSARDGSESVAAVLPAAHMRKVDGAFTTLFIISLSYIFTTLQSLPSCVTLCVDRNGHAYTSAVQVDFLATQVGPSSSAAAQVGSSSSASSSLSFDGVSSSNVSPSNAHVHFFLSGDGRHYCTKYNTMNEIPVVGE